MEREQREREEAERLHREREERQRRKGHRRSRQRRKLTCYRERRHKRKDGEQKEVRVSWSLQVNKPVILSIA